MASIGKGRGWAKAADRETVLRRPGQSISPKTSELEKLIEMIYNLNIEGIPPPDRLEEIHKFVKDIHFEENNYVEKLWEQAMDDRGFAIKFTKLFKPDVTEGLSRRQLYQRLQAYYEKRDELCKENPLRLTSTAWMLGVTCSDAITFRSMKPILGHAILNCMSLLLDSGIEDDTETVAILLYLYGKSIKAALEIGIPREHDPQENVGLSGVVNKARYMHINRNVSPRSRTLSLLIIDLANRHYEPFEGELQKFYMMLLAPSRIPENDSAFLIGREFDQQLYLHKLLSGGMESDKKSNESLNSVSNEKTAEPQRITPKGNRNDKVSGSAPRAIRGAGASSAPNDHKNGKESPRGQREKRTDKPTYSAKRNSNNKAWEHDDRFDNNYE